MLYSLFLERLGLIFHHLVVFLSVIYIQALSNFLFLSRIQFSRQHAISYYFTKENESKSIKCFEAQARENVEKGLVS